MNNLFPIVLSRQSMVAGTCTALGVSWHSLDYVNFVEHRERTDQNKFKLVNKADFNLFQSFCEDASTIKVRRHKTDSESIFFNI